MMDSQFSKCAKADQISDDCDAVKKFDMPNCDPVRESVDGHVTLPSLQVSLKSKVNIIFVQYIRSLANHRLANQHSY